MPATDNASARRVDTLTQELTHTQQQLRLKESDLEYNTCCLLVPP